MDLLVNSKPFLYKNIFPTFEDFDNFLTEYQIEKPSGSNDYLKRIYRILFNNFANSMIKFSTIDDFKGCFANTLEEWLLPYNIQIGKINTILQMSDDDIMRVGDLLDSFSNAPNTIGMSASSQLDYITSQSNRISKGDKLYRYLELLDRLPSYRVGDFIDRFRWLFKRIIPKEDYIFTED